jgi:hypothetical protein
MLSRPCIGDDPDVVRPATPARRGLSALRAGPLDGPVFGVSGDVGAIPSLPLALAQLELAPCFRWGTLR